MGINPVMVQLTAELVRADEVIIKLQYDLNEARNRVAELEAQINRVRDEKAEFVDQVWCALGQPLNVKYVEEIKRILSENKRLRGCADVMENASKMEQDASGKLERLQFIGSAYRAEAKAQAYLDCAEMIRASFPREGAKHG